MANKKATAAAETAGRPVRDLSGRADAGDVLPTVSGTIPRTLLAEIWGFADGHIPAVHRDGWREVIPTDDEAIMMSAELPAAVHESFGLPRAWRKLKLAAQTRIVAVVTMDVLARFRPRYHRALVGGRLIESVGTTIMVTMRGEGHGVSGVPLDGGERWVRAMRRMVERAHRGQPKLGPAALAVLANYLPPWQATVSVVPLARPRSNLFGSAQALCPTVVCAGQEEVSFHSEHRVFNPYEDGAEFAALWNRLLRAAL